MLTTTSGETLKDFASDLDNERQSILAFWIQFMVDQKNGGFYGSLSNDHKPDEDAARGVVINSRILWTFSSAYLKDKDPEYLRMADRAYKYILDNFHDRIYGGIYWSVDKFGNVVDGKKQTYGLAFCIYGLAEYYKATRNERALAMAIDLFKGIEDHCFDRNLGGYIEAFAMDWSEADDLRLSIKDQNERKTMNTHLHVIEAYANLFTCWPDESLMLKIVHLLDVFRKHFIDVETGHLHLFMDEKWNRRSNLVSFGHDVEASWLLLECAQIIGHSSMISQYKVLSIDLAVAASRGLDEDGGLWYEYDPASDQWIKEKHSWPQAEAIVGFLNAWQLTGNEVWLTKAAHVWNFVKENLKDQTNGEWYWGITMDGRLMNKEKAGFWKCPYHAVRACTEVSRRANALMN